MFIDFENAYDSMEWALIERALTVLKILNPL